jgi:hypothetical protein
MHAHKSDTDFADALIEFLRAKRIFLRSIVYPAVLYKKMYRSPIH